MGLMKRKNIYIKSPFLAFVLVKHTFFILNSVYLFLYFFYFVFFLNQVADIVSFIFLFLILLSVYSSLLFITSLLVY